MKHIIIGTAGHVDHGKTALIKALTGTDTDRLKEEKMRGISIDLGFASLRLGDGITAGIVDVPGHERFLKNMLAGTGGIDLALLVIAADEGVMPQTREHLAMLELFGVNQGIVVLNKVDKVDDDWLGLVEEDVKQLVAGTFLEAAPFCRVSAADMTGIDKLHQAILTAGLTLPVRDSAAPFRLWIDRVFSVKGHGAVATGSVLSGSVGVGELLGLYPEGTLLRVRGLEWHGAKVEKIYAGQRAAINLSGEDTGELARGKVLSSPQCGITSDLWDGVADWRQPVASGSRVRLHLGTGEFIGRIYYYKEQSPQLVRLLLERPLNAGLGDRGIIRLYSPQYLLGGIVILAAGNKSRKISPARINLAQAMVNRDTEAIIYGVIDDADYPALEEEIRRRAGYLRDDLLSETLKGLTASGQIVAAGNYYLTTRLFNHLTEELTAFVGQCHREFPERSGASKEIVRQRLRLKEKVFQTLLDIWQDKGLVKVQGADVALQDFAVRHSDWRNDVLQQAQKALSNVGLEPVDWQSLMLELRLSPDKARIIQETLLKEGILIRLGDVQLYSKTVQKAAQQVWRHFQGKSTLTVAELRDALGISRKVAVPLLEYYDAQKYTQRDGNIRHPGPKLQELAE